MMKKNTPDNWTALHGKSARLAPPLRLQAAAVAALIALAAWGPTPVHALGLGRITVLSALGDPLRAEIDIAQITPDEAASLKASIAMPSAYRSAGVEYNAALTGASITLEQRPDGRSFLRVSSDKRINEPFVDLILEASWSSGRIVRDYTLLFDPPSARPVAPAAPTAAQLPAQAPPTASAQPQGVEMQRGAPPVSRARPAVTARSPQAASASPAAPRPPAPSQSTREASGGKPIKVQTGDTAGKIAATYKPADVSLDQMLVALLRTNPDAFINGNVNRIKAGAVVDLPTAEQASSVTTDEARKTLSVQSANFNDYRRKLAEVAPARQVAAADRQASGSLQTRVEEKKPAAASPDKLTLSKGAVPGTGAEAQIAQSRQAKEAGERAAELSRNITELSRLQDKSSAASGAGPAAPAASATRAPALPAGATASAARPQALPPVLAGSAARPAVPPVTTGSAPAAPALATAVPGTASSATAKAPTTVATANTPTATVATGAGAPASSASPAASSAVAASSTPATIAPTTATSSTSTATAAAAAASTTVAAASVGSPAVVASAAISSARLPASGPKPVGAAIPAAAEPSLIDEMLDNPLIPAAAGVLIALLAGFGFYRARQRKKSNLVDSSFLESRLQPDSFFGSSGGQRVDTADAAPTGSSLAYSPSQLDAAGDVDPVAEADVYLAYGRDLQAEEILKEALRTNPTRVVIHAKLLEIYAKRRDSRAFEMIARDAFKLSGGEGADWERICEFGRELDSENPLYQPGGQPAGSGNRAVVAEPPNPVFGSSTIPVEPHPEFDASMPVDLDLGDLDLSYASPPPPAFDASRTVVTAPPTQTDAALDWAAPQPTVATHAQTTPMMPVIDVTAVDLPLDPVPDSSQAEAADAGMIEFDLGSLSLDLDRELPAMDSSPVQASQDLPGPDPLQTKLELAQEFHAIGDADGARALVEEVVALASGPLKAKAQRFLSELG